MACTGRELRNQLFGNASDRPCRVAVPTAGPCLPLNPEHPCQVVGKDGLVQLRERDGRAVHRATVQRPPLAIQHGLDLVADHHVRMQVRVTGTGVVVVVGGGDDTANVDLGDRAVACGRAGAGGGDLTLHEGDHVGNGVMVGLGDQGLRACVSDGPQHAGGFRD